MRDEASFYFPKHSFEYHVIIKVLRKKKINLIAVVASAGDSDEMRSGAEKILKEKGVTYTNIIPDINSNFYKDFICEITGFPITYIVDSEGNMIGASIIGVVSKQARECIDQKIR